MAGYTLLVHPLCKSSYSLLRGLDEKGLLGEFKVVVLDRPLTSTIRGFPWSVPMILDSKGTPLAMDPLGVEEAESILAGDAVVEDDVEQFTRSILYSAYASATVLSHRSLEPLLDHSFLAPALRLPLRRVDYRAALDKLRRGLERLYEENKEVIAKALSLSIVRFLYYSGVRDPDRLSTAVNGDSVSAMIHSMASIGRVNTPLDPGRADMSDYIASFIARRAKGLLRKIAGEHEEITGDEDYWRLIERLRGWRG